MCTLHFNVADSEDIPEENWFNRSVSDPNHATFEEVTTLGLCLNVSVDLIFSPHNGGAEYDNGIDAAYTDQCDYWVKDPERIALQLNLPVSKLKAAAKISPRSTITLRWPQYAAFGIPLNAFSFAWANPIMSEDATLLSAEDDLFCFLNYGGYVYFDKGGYVIKVTALFNPLQRAPTLHNPEQPFTLR